MIFTFAQKSHGGAGPPLGCQGGARGLLPPHVYATACMVMF